MGQSRYFTLAAEHCLSFLDICPLLPLVEDDKVREYLSKLDIQKSMGHD